MGPEHFGFPDEVPLFSARQLKRLVGRICEDDYAKYQLLDERDKIMCKGRVKNADVENATVTQGTCADMCPEKERYQRVVQKRMSTYECDESGNMVPELTVKDYSRSAADQEEPLPHELRPSYVLQRTMNYLISRIAEDIPSREEDLAQWYDFLWNRTRAIRKDITQQLMVNDIAVSLIEQCARLHIFASHRLCELGLNEFDQKMNTENLTKSLQSLRYLYDDLAKKGSYFASEAEFRAYDVLLNLNDSNILREVLTYRRDIRESPEIRLALRLFSCVQSGNYVRFFRLLKEKAAFLQLNRGVELQYPLRKLTELLGFDDETHASSTLGLHGVYLDGDDDEQNVILSKTSFYNPEEQIASKVHAWIEAKRGSRTITEVLSGGQRLKVDLPKATVSFDCSGAYVCDPVLCAYLEEAENEITKSDADDSTTSFTFSLPKTVLKTANQSVELGQYNSDPGPPPTVKREATIADEGENSMQSATQVTTSNMTAGNAFDAFTDGSFKSKSNIPSFTFALAKPRFGVESSSDKGQGVIVFRPRCQEVLMSAKILYRHKLAQQAAQRRKEAVFELGRTILDQLLDDVTAAVANESARKQMRLFFPFPFTLTVLNIMFTWERHAHDRKLLETIASKFCDGLLLEVVDVEVCALCALSMKENVFDVKIRLQQIATNLNRLVAFSLLRSLRNRRDGRGGGKGGQEKQIWLKQFFDIWRSMVATRRERKQRQYEILAAFPTVLPAHSKFHVPRHIPFEKRPIIPDFTSVVVEQKINRFQEKRRKKIVKRAFDHWRRWTRLRIEASVFVKVAFSRQAAMHLRKRRWSMIENRQADPFGLRGALNNEQEAQRRRFGPRLCDLESLSGESASKRASPPRSPQIAIGTPVGNSAGPFLRSLLTDFRSPSSKIWRFGTPVSRTSAQRGIFKISSFTPTGSTPGSSSLNSEKLQAGRVEKVIRYCVARVDFVIKYVKEWLMSSKHLAKERIVAIHQSSYLLMISIFHPH
ncbi:unnamed protein product [Toxocara canis]|uniref:SAC3_GANP domain-containing protein n=1 Tax=Toxocara canis TaxID=6265 RepID=A0A183ULJ5_TOXCA|nr:unnamed protein product [Toxocara canis]